MWDQIVVWLQRSVVDIARGSDKQDTRTVQLVYGVEELLAEEPTAETRVQDTHVSAFRVARRVPKVTHHPRILARVDCIGGISEAVLVKKLQRHQTNGPVNTRDTDPVITNSARNSRNVSG